MRRRIFLHGQLGRRFGRVHHYDVRTPAEAVHALATTLPGFREYFEPRRYSLVVGRDRQVCRDTLLFGMGAQQDLHITPAGAVAGTETVLLIGSLVLSAATAILSLAMAPKAKNPGARETQTQIESYIFDGPQNRTEQGHPVALVYGRMRVGSVVVSAGIATTDVNQASVQQSSGYQGSTPGIHLGPHGSAWVTLEKGGKGGGASRAAQEDPNSLQSQATARIIDAVSEGEIGGLVDGLKSVYLDNTPLQNPDGSFNFSGIVIDERVGLPDQDYIPGFPQTEATTDISTKVSILAGPVTRTITDPDVTLARVTIGIPALWQQDTTNGDLRRATVRFQIAVQHNGGGFTTVVDKEFTEKTNSPYQCSYDIALPAGTGPHDIRVTRITPDNASASLANDTYWDLLTEIVEAKLSYPDTALYGLTVDARQFGSNIPARSYEIYGLIVDVPTNYDPVTRAYTGVWDGTFKRAWTDNPAWVYWDIATKRRYGCGARITSAYLDKWTLYAIAQYNDELIPDGLGGTRPRYTCNVVIDTEVAAFDLLASVTSIFRGWAYWSSGGVSVAQDRPETPSAIVNTSNVVGGLFEYGRVTDLESRRSVVIVYWNDPSDGYRLTPEIIERPDLVRRFGWRPGESITAFGCTDQSQARRMGLWVFEDEGLSNKTTKYRVGDDHAFVAPGRIATLADPMFSGVRRGGRIKSGTSSSIVLDSAVTLNGGEAYALSVTLPDGTVETSDVTTPAGTVSTLAVSPALSQSPNPGAVWSLESDVVANRQFRVRNITTAEPPYEVDAVLYDPTKFDRVEQGVDIQPVNYIGLPQGPLVAPSGITISEFLYLDGTATIPSVQVSWHSGGDPRIVFYQAQYLPPGGNWVDFADSLSLSREVRGTSPGSWSFRVRGVDSLNRKTEWVQKTFVLDGNLSAIPNVSGLALVADDDAITPVLTWTAPTDPRPLRYEVFYGPDDVLANATSLGVTDSFEWPVKQAGFYFVQSVFLTSRASNPPHLEITVTDLPEVKWSRVLGRPVNLDDLDSVAAAAIAQNQADIDELFTTAGSALDAAASAAAALASESAAATYASTASTAATNAANSASNSLTQATNAATSAGQASTYASQASNSATSAAGSASTASTQASLAAGSATAAAGSATAASGSASTASTQATNASNSASAASAAQVSAQSVAASLFPDRYQTGSETNFKAIADSGVAGSPASISSSASNATLSGYGPVYQFVSASETFWDFAQVGVIPTVAGKTYEVEVEYLVVAFSGSPNIQVVWRCMDSAYATTSTAGSGNVTITATGTFTRAVKISNTASSGVLAWDAGAVWLRPFFRATKASGTYTIQAKRITVRDVTEALAAAGSAAAAATSASTATTQANNAATSATAAQNSATTATTQASAAATSAGQASTSATNAAGSASSASTQATNASNSAGAAGASATAASNSASSAATQASNAAGSASTASTQATNASNSATNASNSASAASNSASTASTQATNAGNSASAAAASATTASTQAGIAATQATSATNQAVVATNQAAAASSSATLAASVGTGSITANPNFALYPSTPAQPTSWIAWDNTGNGGNPSRVTGELPGSYALQESTTAGAGQGSYQSSGQNAAFGNFKTGDYLVLEGQVKLNSGSLQGSGMHIQYRDASNAAVDSDSLSFYTDPDSTGTIVGAGSVGKTYRFTKLVKSGVANVTNFVLYRMTGWAGFGTVAAKQMQWFRCSARPATAQEIAAGVALPALEATVTTQGGAIATLQGKTAAHLSLVAAAGSSAAAVRLVADSYAGSLLELQADAIRLGAANLPAMSVVGGNVYIYGQLQVANLSAITATIGTLRTATTGARMELKDNVIKVYDSSNVLRIRIGDQSL